MFGGFPRAKQRQVMVRFHLVSKAALRSRSGIVEARIVEAVAGSSGKVDGRRGCVIRGKGKVAELVVRFGERRVEL